MRKFLRRFIRTGCKDSVQRRTITRHVPHAFTMRNRSLTSGRAFKKVSDKFVSSPFLATGISISLPCLLRALAMRLLCSCRDRGLIELYEEKPRERNSLSSFSLVYSLLGTTGTHGIAHENQRIDYVRKLYVRAVFMNVEMFSSGAFWGRSQPVLTMKLGYSFISSSSSMTA